MRTSRKLAFRFLSAFLLALGVLAGAEASAVTSPSPLRKIADLQMKHRRLGAAVAALGPYIYIFGGSNGITFPPVERLDTRTKEITELPVELRGRRFHAVLEDANQFYIFGGEALRIHGFDDAVEVFDPVSGKVELSTSMPRPHAHMGAAKVGRDVYLIGGTYLADNRPRRTNRVRIFNLDRKEWRDGPPMPTVRETVATTVGDFILVPGGFDRNNKRAEVEMFVPSENAWKTLPPISPAVSAHSVAHLGKWLFLFGDYDNLGQVLAYDLPTRQTSRISPGYKDARHTAAITHGNQIYVIGGNVFGDGLEREYIQVYELDPAYQGR